MNKTNTEENTSNTRKEHVRPLHVEGEIIACISPLYDADADSATIACVEEDLGRKLDRLTEAVRKEERESLKRKVKKIEADGKLTSSNPDESDEFISRKLVLEALTPESV